MRQEDQLHYRNINDLYEQYIKAPDDDKETFLQELLEETLKLKYRRFGREISYGEYFEEVVNKKVKVCLKSYLKKTQTYKDKVPFSQYVCSGINNMIGSLLKKQTLEEKNGGITISDHTQKKVSKLKKILNNLEITCPDLDGESCVEIAAKMLGVKRNTVIRYLQIMTGGERVDAETVPLADKTASPEKELISGEEAIKTLCKIETVWNKKPDDKMLSKLLTVCVLDMFDMEKDDLDYDFIDRTILDDYSAQKNYRFPEAQEIAEKYGYTDKSAATQKLKRFGKKIGIEFKYPRQSKKS